MVRDKADFLAVRLGSYRKSQFLRHIADLVKIMVESDMAKVAAEDAGQKVRCNLAEYLEKGIVK